LLVITPIVITPIVIALLVITLITIDHGPGAAVGPHGPTLDH
jgi:preprotein translocase subunit SecG